MNFDQRCRELIEQEPNLMVPWYLTSSYLYYKLDFSILSDECYDEMCKEMLSKWESIEHMHKHLIDPEQLKAGTGYAIDFETLPERVKSAAQYQKRTLEDQKKPKRKKKKNV